MNPNAPSNHLTPGVPPALAVARPRLGLPVWGGICLAVVVAGLILHFFNPTEHRFYPTCMFHAMTGWNCPGCGGLRAVHQLTHGNFVAAFHCNPLVALALLAVCLVALYQLIPGRSGRSRAALVTHPAVVWSIVAVVVVFSVLRNLPFHAFAWMSP